MKIGQNENQSKSKVVVKIKSGQMESGQNGMQFKLKLMASILDTSFRFHFVYQEDQFSN